MSDGVLSERELRAVTLIARGFRNTDVAGALGVSLRTVEADRARVMRKLGISRRAELVRWALERGLLV
jgi:two-component system, NarL family, response regulator NreC